MHRTRVNTLEVLTWTTISFWTEVPFPSLAKTKVLSAIQNEQHGAKNKGVKPQGTKTYLTLCFISIPRIFYHFVVFGFHYKL
jgi:hypothetical protein